METRFAVGDYVVKPKGYDFDSYVVAVFTNRAGAVRLVCESAMIPGMLHIFSPSQMEHGQSYGEPGRWWRVLIRSTGELWAETSSELEARNKLRLDFINDFDDLEYGEIDPNRKLQRMFNLPNGKHEWRDVS